MDNRTINDMTQFLIKAIGPVKLTEADLRAIEIAITGAYANGYAQGARFAGVEKAPYVAGAVQLDRLESK